jgi:hypothetical protein
LRLHCSARQLPPQPDQEGGDAANDKDKDRDEDKDEEDKEEDKDEDGFGGAVSSPDVMARVDLAKTVGESFSFET